MRLKILLLFLGLSLFSALKSTHAAILFEHGFEGETLNSEAWLQSEVPDWWQAASQNWSAYIYRYASNDFARDGFQSVKVHTQYTAAPVSGYRAEFTRRGSIGGAVEQFDIGQEYWIGWSIYLPTSFDIGEGYNGEAIHGQIHGIPDAYYATGTHTGGAHSTILTDSTKTWVVNGLIGATLHNTKDVSSGIITSNTANTATVTALTEGTDNRWEVGDTYRVQELDTNPPIGITLEKASGVIGWACVIRGDDEPITATAGKDRYIKYDLGTATKGAWTDFVINMKLDYHSTGNAGFFKLWVNGSLLINESGEQNCYNDVNGPFIAWGSYHYPWTSGVPTVTDEIIYIDSIKVGDSTSSYLEVAPGSAVELVSASIDITGSLLQLEFSAICETGGGSDSWGFGTAVHGTHTLNYLSGSGTTIWNYSISPVVRDGELLLEGLNYEQGALPEVTNLYGAPLDEIINFTLINNSTLYKSESSRQYGAGCSGGSLR